MPDFNKRYPVGGKRHEERKQLAGVDRCPTTGKIRYPTRQIAKKASKKFKPRKYAYRCLSCGAFHLTKMECDAYTKMKKLKRRSDAEATDTSD